MARLARGLVERCRELTLRIKDLTAVITTMVSTMEAALMAIPGCGALTAAKILGETAGVDRFRSKDAFARHTGTAPMPVWSSHQARHRRSRTGNRQLDAALHRIALPQAHWHEPAQAMMARRKAGGDSGLEALRVLTRRLSDVVYAALRADLTKSHRSPSSLTEELGRDPIEDWSLPARPPIGRELSPWTWCAMALATSVS